MAYQRFFFFFFYRWTEFAPCHQTRSSREVQALMSQILSVVHVWVVRPSFYFAHIGRQCLIAKALCFFTLARFNL